MDCVPVRLGLLLLLSLMGAPALLADDPPERTDAALVSVLKPLLPPRGTVEAFEKALGDGPRDGEVRDLGFGGRSRSYDLWGESAELDVHLLSFEGRIAGIRILSDEGTPEWWRSVRRSWGRQVVVGSDGIEYRALDPAVYAKWMEAVAAGLGKPPTEPVNESLQESVTALTDPLRNLTFGTVCYEDGSPPEGRRLINLLHRPATDAALLGILRGPSPEGRVYAADALLRREWEGETLKEELKTAVDRVLALPISVRACAGCEVYDETAAKLLPPDRWKRLLACRIVEQIDKRGRWIDRYVFLVYWDGVYSYRAFEHPKGPKVSTRWRRGRVDEEYFDPILESVQKDGLFTEEDGTPTYRLRPQDATAVAPPGVREFRDSLLLPR